MTGLTRVTLRVSCAPCAQRSCTSQVRRAKRHRFRFAYSPCVNIVCCVLFFLLYYQPFLLLIILLLLLFGVVCCCFHTVSLTIMQSIPSSSSSVVSFHATLRVCLFCVSCRMVVVCVRRVTRKMRTCVLAARRKSAPTGLRC